MRLGIFLPDGVRVVAQRFEVDLRAARRRARQRGREVSRTHDRRRAVDAPLVSSPPTSGRRETLAQDKKVVFEDGATFEVRDGETILAAATRSGVELDYSCTLGGCGACMLQVIDGLVVYDDPGAICLSETEIVQGWCLACVGRPKTNLALRR